MVVKIKSALSPGALRHPILVGTRLPGLYVHAVISADIVGNVRPALSAYPKKPDHYFKSYLQAPQKLTTVQENHFMMHVGWLRAAVLGANDGILSTASVVIGVASASTERYAVVIAALSALVAGALSMAAGEYVSVSSQADLEKADLQREQQELRDMPEEELTELAKIYEARGLSATLALQVAEALTAHDALQAHARDELGINDFTKARPLQAALASAASFVTGGIFPLLISLFAPLPHMVLFQYLFAIVALGISGYLAAKSGGSPVAKSIWRICIWGTIAMGITALTGYLFGSNIS